MKKFTCILLSLLIFATPILAQNPCEDSTYLELKKKKLDDLSDREYEYFTRKDKECSAYLSKTPEKSQNNNLNKDGLNPEQVKSYNRKRITIELVSKTEGGAFATPIGKSTVGGFSAETSRKWKAHKGFEKISEEEFCRITGYDKEADDVKKYISTSKQFIWGGLLAIIIGVQLMNKTDNMSRSVARDRNLSIGFFGGICLGTSSVLGGLLQLAKNKYEYSVVDGMAEEYNRKVLQRIKGTTP